MKILNKKFQSGFTFLELMIVLGIVVLLAAVVNFSFSKLNGSQTVDKATLSAISILNSAHSLAISGKDESGFGVRILKNKIISFKGAYGTSNSTTSLSNLIAISTSSGIGMDIIFSNLYGNTTASGTIKIYLVSDPTHTSSTIQIFSTGAVQRN